MAAASVALYERRSALCLEHNTGLTGLNRQITEGEREYHPFKG